MFGVNYLRAGLDYLMRAFRDEEKGSHSFVPGDIVAFNTGLKYVYGVVMTPKDFERHSGRSLEEIVEGKEGVMKGHNVCLHITDCTDSLGGYCLYPASGLHRIGHQGSEAADTPWQSADFLDKQ